MTAIGGRRRRHRDGHAGPSVVRWRELYRLASAHRADNYLFSERVHEPLGSCVAALAIRARVHPTVLTLANLVLAIATSALVIARAGDAQPCWLPGVAGFVGWQLAYVLDCADGQVARATGKTSSFGARVDLLADVLGHALIISALLTVVTRRTELPATVLVLGGMLSVLGILVYALARADGNDGHSFTRRGGVVAVLKLVGDHGFLLFVLGGWLFVAPHTVLVPVAVVYAANLCFLLASIGREAYLSMRPG
jgi:phosphatidylglycerophosphate synthase